MVRFNKALFKMNYIQVVHWHTRIIDLNQIGILCGVILRQVYSKVSHVFNSERAANSCLYHEVSYQSNVSQRISSQCAETR